MTFDLSGDLELADNTETVTVTTRRSAGDTQIEIGGALRRALNRAHDRIGGIVLEGDELVWNIPERALSSSELEPGDTITEDAIADIEAQSVVWTVLSAAKVTFGTRWLAVCRQQR